MARVPRHRTLDEIEQAPAWRRRPWFRRTPEPAVSLPLGGGNCWCGLANGHRWEGMDEGAPHPRIRRQHIHTGDGTVEGCPGCFP